nr:sporulation histidine kinase inhibitor Sda [Neobacillus drentensis]
MQLLQDTFLIDAYHEAIRLELGTDFIHLLLTEISHRNLIHVTIN